ncbi:ATPase [Pseudidiomarina aestuarii]|uniref:ATPase n=1 Tax=Pseudidiomarina aestuarii TaxID=624146 RepID=A0A7Z6ZTK9_9GAMM|nr:YcjX family protein [Pseudidiomarina aestuarii]RUO41157.1 ATPase [Pseudidiomarina aestuarii]
MQLTRLKKLQQQGRDLLDRGLDRHIRLGVTGLSGAGKTALITSLIDQLSHSASYPQKLPRWSLAAQRRIVDVKFAAQPDWSIARFDYEGALQALRAESPQWPESTTGLSELRLELTIARDGGWKQAAWPTQKLVIDLFDYPGEWLLDLPLLDMTFEDWSTAQLKLLHEPSRELIAKPWLTATASVGDIVSTADLDAVVRHASAGYRDLLKRLRYDVGVFWSQPGRMLLPGSLEGAPILDFFPWPGHFNDQTSALTKALQQRFERYKAEVVTPFYRDYFCRFNRQIVLVDILGAMQRGPVAFADLRLALSALLPVFHYGRNSWWQRLWRPHIERVAFIATKADLLTLTQQRTVLDWLQELVGSTEIDVDSAVAQMQQVVAAVRATEYGHLADGREVLRGSVDGTQRAFHVDYLPAFGAQLATPVALPKLDPPDANEPGPLPNLRIDQLLEFLLGDLA